MAWDLSCTDWEQRLLAGTSLVPELPLDMAAAALAVEVFDRLRLPDVPGNPLLRDACPDWFRDIVRALFGSYDSKAQRRHVEEVFALVAKKNSKTTYSAALMVTALLVNKRPLAELLFVGPTQAISDLAFGQAVGMIELDPWLREKCILRQHLKEIIYRPLKARLKVKTFDQNILTGPKPVGVLLDELHLLGRNAHAAKILLQIRGGREANPEGFLVIITTQSDEPPAGVFRSELMRARMIRDGKIRDAVTLPVLYEFPRRLMESDAWRDPKNWPMVTPNAGRSVSIERLERAFKAAQDGGPDQERLWASQHLNVEIGLSLGSDRWVGADYWHRQGDPELTLAEILRRSEVVCVGIDGGGLDDLLGLVVLGRDAETRDWLLWGKAWAHESVLERRQTIAPKLRDLAAAGELVIVPQLVEAFEQAAALVQEIDETGRLALVGLDPYGVGAIVDELALKGIAGAERVVAVTQGFKLQGAIKTAEVKLAAGTLHHAGQALMAWSVGNAKVEPKGNAITITKQAAGTAKIDPLIAAFCAVSLMSNNPAAPPPPSPWESPDYRLPVY